MIESYNKFVKLNEEDEFGGNKASKGIGGFLKKMLGGLVQNVKDEFKKPLDDFNKKLSNQKDIQDMSKTVNDYLIVHQKSLISSLEDAKTLPTIAKTVEDNLRTAYASIKATIQNFGTDTYTFDEIFKSAPERTKKLFDKNEKNFSKRVPQFSEDLVLSFGKTYKFSKDDLKTEKIDYEFNFIENMEKFKKLYEADDETNQQPNDETNQQPNDETNQQSNEEIKKQENLKKLKDDIKLWFDNTIYRNTKKSLEETKKEDKQPKKEVDITSKIESIPDNITRNKDSVKDIVNKLADSDKQTMMNVRDVLGLNKDDTPL